MLIERMKKKKCISRGRQADRDGYTETGVWDNNLLSGLFSTIDIYLSRLN